MPVIRCCAPRWAPVTIGLAVTVLIAGALAPAQSDRSAVNAGPSTKLSDLAWLHGDWNGRQDGDRLEEIWSAPVEDSMMGMFRWIKDGRVWMFELITITAEDDGMVLRLRHFDRRLVGWEEKDEALTYPLVRHGPGEAVFENAGRDHPRRFVYRLVGDDRLSVSLESFKDGELKATTLLFDRG